jgi:hypothetical protein
MNPKIDFKAQKSPPAFPWTRKTAFAGLAAACSAGSGCLHGLGKHAICGQSGRIGGCA